MSATAAATERHEKETKLRNSSSAAATLVKRNASNPRKVTAIDFRPNELSSSLQIKSNKLKTTVEEQRNNAVSRDITHATANRLPANQRERWKNSNLFSKTLSSIDTMNASSAKKGNSNLTTVSIESASGTNPMVSAPINSTSSSSSSSSTMYVTSAATSAASVSKSSEWKLLKYKLGLGLLRKKANKEISANLCHQTGSKCRDAVESNADCCTTAGKHEKSPQASHQQRSISPCDTTPANTNSATANTAAIVSKRSLTQDEGIVCKSEDLLFLISEASKGVKSSKTKGNKDGIKEEKERTASYSSCTPNTSNNSSTSLRRTSLNKQNSSGSQSSDTEEKGAKQTNVRRANSCAVEKVVKASHNKLMESRVKICVDSNSNDCENENNDTTRAEQRGDCAKTSDILSEQFKETSTKAHNCLYNDNDCESHNKRANNEPNEVSPVKWDESNIVDPMIFGNAIQAFLRGLNNTTNEKRVSFKKSF